MLNRREINILCSSLELPGARGKSIEYKRLTDILEGTRSFNRSGGAGETWRDVDYGTSDKPAVPERRGRSKGSVGEWLVDGACPAEQKNFRKFIDAMERFERDTGMKIQPEGDGFTVPIGPDLRASVKFFMP